MDCTHNLVTNRLKVLKIMLDYEQSLFFLSPSKKTRENAHARDWRCDSNSRAWLTEEKRETARSLKSCYIVMLYAYKSALYITMSFPFLLSRSSLEPLISLDLVGRKLYWFRARVPCYHCLYTIFSTNPVRRSKELRGDLSCAQVLVTSSR